MNTGLKFALTPDERQFFESVVRRRKAAALVVRRANALLLLDDGLGPVEIAKLLYLDEETIRVWQRRFAAEGRALLEMKGYKPREGHLSRQQEAALRTYLGAHPLRSTNEVRDYIGQTYGQEFSRSGAIKLMARLGFVYRKPAPLPAVADAAAQEKFIRDYETLLNALPPDEGVLFADAVHPEYQSRPAYGWFLKDSRPALKTTSGRQRLNLHGALNLEDFTFRFVQEEKINAVTTRRLLAKIEAAYPSKRVIHVFADNARYHHARVLQPWLAAPERRVKLHFLPSYAPHLNPIERLWGVMHEHVTHNRHYPDFGKFADAILRFFRTTLPRNWQTFRDTVTDNFRVVTHNNHQLIQW